MKIKLALKKMRLGVYPVLVQHSSGKTAKIASGCLFWAWHHLDTNNSIILEVSNETRTEFDTKI